MLGGFETIWKKKKHFLVSSILYCRNTKYNTYTQYVLIDHIISKAPVNSELLVKSEGSQKFYVDFLLYWCQPPTPIYSEVHCTSNSTFKEAIKLKPGHESGPDAIQLVSF